MSNWRRNVKDENETMGHSYRTKDNRAAADTSAESFALMRNHKRSKSLNDLQLLSWNSHETHMRHEEWHLKEWNSSKTLVRDDFVLPRTSVFFDRKDHKRQLSDPTPIMGIRNTNHHISKEQPFEDSLVQSISVGEDENDSSPNNDNNDDDDASSSGLQNNHSLQSTQNDRLSVADILQKYNIFPLNMEELYHYLQTEKIQQEQTRKERMRAVTWTHTTPTAGATTTTNIPIPSSPSFTPSIHTKQTTSTMATSKYSFGTQLFQSWTVGKNNTSTTTTSTTTTGSNGSTFMNQHEDASCNSKTEQPTISEMNQDNHKGPCSNNESNVQYSYDVFVNNDIRNSPPAKQEAFLLYFLFRKFSSPSPTFDSIRILLEKEQCINPLVEEYGTIPLQENGRCDIELPQDAVINIGTSAAESIYKEDDPQSMIPQLLRNCILFEFPLYFQRAFLRILIRILTNESDEEFDRKLRFGSKIYHERYRKHDASKSANSNRRSSFSGQIPKDSRFCHFLSQTREDFDFSQDILYSVVRLRFGEWKGKSLVDDVMNMMGSLVHSSSPLFDEVEEKSMISSLSRLLGLLSSTGVTPLHLRTMFQWISDTSSHPYVNVHILRALIVATEASSVTTKLRGKSSPKSFFCFGRSGGISHMIYPHLNSKISRGWPFKNAFSFACWFRVECFMQTNENPILFKIQSGDGTGFDIRFRILQTEDNRNSVANLVYIAQDSNKYSQSSSREFELKSCPIVPRVWYHIAIRHLKKRYLSLQKDELAIFIDGKLIEKKNIMFPVSTAAGSDSMLNMSNSRQIPSQPIKIDCFRQIDAEAGALYIFNGVVTDSTFKSLYEYTSGTSDSERSVKESDTSQHQDDSDTLKQADINEIVIPQSNLISNQTINAHNSDMNIIDLIGDDDFCSEVHKPIKGEFSRSAFISHLFLVWDPLRVSDDCFILEAHSKIHVFFDQHHNSKWLINCLKDVIRSIGGVQSLLPLMKTLIGPSQCQNISDDWNIFSCQKILSLCFYLLSSFLRDSDINGREFLRCGGTEILSDFIYDSKIRFAKAVSKGKLTNRSNYIHSFRWCRYAAEDLTNALTSLNMACNFDPILRMKILSRLIFNVDLWFGGVNDAPGIAFHSVFLPTLSVIAKLESSLLTDTIRISSFINLIRELTIISTHEDHTDNQCFDEVSRQTKLTASERNHLVDISLGIIFSILCVKVTSKQLSPLLQFISFNLDSEWEANNDRGISSKYSNGTQTLRFDATVKACALLTILLQFRPVIPGLFDSLNVCLGDIVSWLLCCLVNSHDDKVRSNGIKCFVALYDTLLTGESFGSDQSSFAKQLFGMKHKAMQTFKNVGSGLGVIPKVFQVSPKSVGVAYKLLWYILKSHRYNIGHLSHNALLHALVKKDATTDCSQWLDDLFVVEDHVLRFGYFFNSSPISLRNKNAQIDGKEWYLRNNFATATILELLRFLPVKDQEIWLFDLLTLVRVSPSCKNNFLDPFDWQHCLFHVASDTVEELCSFNMSELHDEKRSDEDKAHNSRHRNLYARFDLIFELYATLVANCLRIDEGNISCVEEAAALQRVSLNGKVVFSVLLSHILADIIKYGSMAYDHENQFPHKDIKDCAKLFLEMDLANAASHWKKIRHFVTICVATIVNHGFGLADLFDYKNNLSVMLDEPSGGLFGIRLDDDTVSGITAVQIVGISRLTQKKDGTNSAHHRDRDLKRRVSTTIAAQVLEMIDPYIFPDSSGIESASSSHQHVWHTLLRSVDPCFGDEQGPLLFSLVRVVLVSIAYLEPSSSKFLKFCYLLRCFQRWCMDMIVDFESSEDDRSRGQILVLEQLIICIVLQCHRTLFRCYSALKQVELATHDECFPAHGGVKQTRRIYKSVQTLIDVISDIFELKGDTLRISLSQDSFESLKNSLASKANRNKTSLISTDQSDGSSQDSQELSLRIFLNSNWIQNFHDNDFAKENKSDICFAIPELLKSSTSGVERGLKGNDKGYIIAKALSDEAIRICNEFNSMLDEPFQKYLSSRIKWTDSTAVRDLEYNGNLFIMNLSSQFREGIKERMRSETMCSNISKQRYRSIQTKIEIDTKYHWKLARHPDTLHRRILLIPNRCFDDHASASYDIALGVERDHALLANQDRLYSENNNDLMKMVKVAQEGIVKRNRSLSQEIVSDFINDDDVSIESIADANLSEKGELITDWDQLEFEREAEAANPKKKGTHDWSKEFIWDSNEKFINLFDDVQIVTVNAVVEGEIVLTTHNIYFRPTDDPISVVTKEKFDSKRKEDIITDDGRWRLSRLQQVHGRRFMLRAQAVELFFADTHQLFLNFRNGSKVRDKFVEKLRQCRIPLLSSIPISLNPRVLFKKKFSTLTESWKERKISNFEYLMELNIMAGRTFNDISQYPVFPWVIADFESEHLDLEKQSTFRDLSKPVGALNPDRLAQFIERYHDLDGLPDDEKFLYGSHYSSPGVVLHYLIRQEPFTSMAIDLQSGRFDCPDRLFYNIGACWKSCLSSTSDVKELVPELFTCPEVLLNTNNYPLGKTQSRMSISNVILPPWANGSAYEFIRLHRLALESEYVSSNLHHWIDLIFGYKQTGIEAIKANNVFHFLSYEGSVDLNRITDEIDRAATESQIQNFGQIPYQLLCTEPHPQRYAREKCWMPVINELDAIRRLTCFTPVKQFNNSNKHGTHGSVLSIQVLPDYVVVIYADLNVGMYQWSPFKHGKAPFYFRMDKMRPIVTKEMSISSFSMGLRDNGQANDDKIRGRDIGNWSFALTINDKIHAKASRSVGLTKTKDVSSSSIDVTLLSCGYCDNTLKAHTLDGLRLKSSETGGHLGQINCIRLAEDGTLLVTGGDDATVRVWTVENPNMAVALIDSYIQTAQGPIQKSNALSCCLVLWGHGRSVISLACSSALDIVVSGSENGTICIHTIRRGTFIRSIKASDFPPSERVINSGLAIQNLALHSDGIFVAYLESGLLQMYTINGVKLACVDCGEKLKAMEMIPGGHSLVTGGDSGHVIIRSLRDLEIQYILDLSDYGAIRCVSFTPPPSKNTKSIHQFMLVGSFDGSVTVVCSDREYELEGDESQDSFTSDAQTAAYRARYIQHHSKNIQKR